MLVTPAFLLKQFQYCADLMLQNVEGITHEQSLYQPAPGMNSINWLVGHLISSRTRVLTFLGQPPIWNEDQRARYRNGSDIINAEGQGVVAFADVVRDYRLTHEATIIGFHGAKAAENLTQTTDLRGPTAADAMIYLHFHEAHHIGQIMSIREHLGLKSYWLT